MNHARFSLCATVVLLTALPGPTADPPKKAEPAAPKIDLDELAPHPDLEWLRRAKVPTDDAGLVKYLKGLRGPEPDPAEVDRLVTQLRNGTQAEQDAAAAKLAEVGAVAVPVLRRHRLGPDAAAAGRVRTVLAKLEEAADKPLARPAMRRLVMRNAPGAADALLGYAPFAFDPAAELDAWYGLDELAARDAKVLTVLAGALADKQPARRAVAACILGRRDDATQKKAVAGLLKDADPEVRLRAAQGLLAGRDITGVPTLINLLTDASVEVRWQAEELLRWLAVDTAPDLVVGAGEPKAMAACQAAWRKWWTDRGGKADVAAAEKEPRRPLLLLAYDRKGGRCWVVGCDGVTRHEWTGLDRLTDAQYVPGGGVLTLHEQPVREKPLLAERDLDGKALWQHDHMLDPQYCQRLGNGHIFVAEKQDVAVPYLTYQVVAPGGRIVATRPQQCSAPKQHHAFRMLDDGRIVCVWLYIPSTDGTRFNAPAVYDPATDTTQKLWSTSVAKIGIKPYVEPNPEGGYLVSGLANTSAGNDRTTEIHEYDCDGQTFWTYKAPGLIHAIRLRGGTTIGCADDRLIEISADRRMVGEIPMTARPSAARQCLGLVRFGFEKFPGDTDLETDIDYRIRCLKMKEPKARLFALQRLGDFRWWAARAIPQLQAHGEDPDPAVRQALRGTLVAIGVEEIPKLLAEAKHVNPDRRYDALEKVRFYINGPKVLDALLEAIHDDNPRVRSIAVLGLNAWEKSSQSRPTDQVNAYRTAVDRSVPALVKALNDPDDRVRQNSMRALGKIGVKAKAAVPALIGILKNDMNPDNRSVATMVLGQIGDGSPEVVAALYSAFKDPKYPWTRRMAASALSHLRPVPKRATEWFLDTYRMPDAKDSKDADTLRSTCLGALTHIRANDPTTLEFMKEIMNDSALNHGDRLIVARYLFTIPDERASTFRFMTRWAEQETHLSARTAVQEQFRQLKMALRKLEP